MISWTLRKTDQARVDKAVKSQFEGQREYWKNILRKIVSTVKFLSQRGLAFKGDVQKFGWSYNGNYLGCLEYLSLYDQLLADHVKHYGNKGDGHTS